jgi:hypothetical protein
MVRRVFPFEAGPARFVRAPLFVFRLPWIVMFEPFVMLCVAPELVSVPDAGVTEHLSTWAGKRG